MAIDTQDERVSAINQFFGLRVLFPNGSIDQNNRQASCRTCTAVLAIPPIIFLDGAIVIDSAISATLSNDSAIDAALFVDPAIDAIITMN